MTDEQYLRSVFAMTDYANMDRSDRVAKIVQQQMTHELGAREQMFRDFYAFRGAPYGWETSDVLRWFAEHWEPLHLSEYFFWR